MAFFNYSTMQMAAKIVYYGPGLCGKTTNLQYIYNKTSPKSRGEMVSLETETDRTLFFDLLPIEVGTISGFKTRFQLYTVPGQVFYGETRRMVLRGVDGVVFVADSQVPMKQANIESLQDLESNLAGMGMTLKDIPIVLQYNKRDLQNVIPVEELEKDLNWHSWPSFESSAINGKGVFDTLKGVSRLTLHVLKSKLVKPQETVVARSHPAAQDRKPRKAVPGIGPKAPGAIPVPAPMVEFETLKTQISDKKLASTAPKLKTVTTTGHRVANELDRIRESLLAPLLGSSRPKVKDLTPTLNRIKKTTLQGPKEKVISIGMKIPGLPELDASQMVRLEISVKVNNRKKAVKRTVTLGGTDFQKAGDEWLAKLKVFLKKA